MSDVRLSIIVPTLGRPTLWRTLDVLSEQVAPEDEVLVVCAEDVFVPVDRLLKAGCRVFQCLKSGPGRGDAERNLGMLFATGTHIAFMDDDDHHTPGALQAMRDHATDRPVIFRMDATQHGNGILWRDKHLAYCNVSTQMFLVPNIPAKLARWAPFNGPHACDWVFIRDTVALHGTEPVWREEIVAELGPSGVFA